MDKVPVIHYGDVSLKTNISGFVSPFINDKKQKRRD